MALRALLFDLDGTLAETEAHGHRPSYNRAFRKLGLSFRWGPKLYRRLLAQPSGRERLHHYLRRYQPDLGEHAEAVSESEEAWVEHVHRLKSRYFRRYLRQGKVPLRPGVARLLREASEAGLRLAVVTNASRASVRSFLKYGLGKELTGRIDLVVGGDQISARKPAPDAYHYALKRLKVAPYECIAIEDSAMGLSAARAAGVPTVITVNGDTAGQDFSSATLVLDTLGEPDTPSTVMAGRIDESWLGFKTLRRIARSAAPRL
jgi:HAD superfamily hydrolase (TIGR01509 family)